VLVAIASSLVFAAIVWATVINTPGWASVQQAFFDPQIALQALPKIWDGFLINLQVLGISLVTVSAVALLIAVLRTCAGRCSFRCASSRRPTPTSSAVCRSSSCSTSSASACRRS
jgi:polar amino acid transport system permease protein